MSVTIRELNPNDVQKGLLETLKALAPVEIDPLNGTILARCFVTRRWLPRVHAFVAETEDGYVVGTATLLVIPKLIHHGEPVGQVEDVAVHPDWQGQGIGRRLMLRCIEAARESRCRKVILNCSETNIPFYASLGFRPHEVGMRLDLNYGGAIAE